MAKIAPIWLDIGPKSGQTKSKKKCPEMTQNGLEMVPIASGGPGNLFLYYNNIFYIKKKRGETNICSEMTQNGLEMVPVASGGPGNLFLLYNNVFLY